MKDVVLLCSFKFELGIFYIVVIKFFNQFLLLGAGLTALFNSCVTYSSAGEYRLELPKIADGETIITYSGYPEIRYDSKTADFPEVKKIAYTVSYDSHNKIPRWVAYDLTSEELIGTATRKGKNFRPDERAGVPQADNNDYRNSGWTRGHLAPAGDFKWDDSAMNDTFYYTNCCPQSETLNTGSWQKLEDRVRDWAKMFGEVYIITGPIIGSAENGTIGMNRVTIPDAFFKAVLARDGESYQAVAFILENSSASQSYTNCCLSVNELEDIIGIDLFPSLEDRIEETVESSFNKRFWGM